MPATRLRVLHVIKGLGPGGAEKLLCSAAVARDADAFDYDVAYLLPWKNHLVPELEASGVATRCLGRGSESGGAGRVLADPRWLAALTRALRSRRYDIVHVHSPVLAAATRPLVRAVGRAPRGGRPGLVSTEHNGWDTYGRLTGPANRWTYPLDDARVVVSAQVRDSIPASRRRGIQVIVHGVARQQILRLRAEREQVRAELGLAPDDVAVATVANYRAQKAYPDLLAAARKVLDEHPEARFLAVGQGPLRTQIEAEHARLGLGDRFRLLGYRPDAARVLAGCDVFVLSSLYEGFPVALMEAMTLGLPVVSTAVGGVPDAVSNGVEGLLVPPGQPAQLADALQRVLDPEIRAPLAAASARRGTDFDIAQAVGRLEQIYRRVVARCAA